MIRFFNGRTLTMAHGVTVTTDEVWTDGDKIAYVNPATVETFVFPVPGRSPFGGQ